MAGLEDTIKSGGLIHLPETELTRGPQTTEKFHKKKKLWKKVLDYVGLTLVASAIAIPSACEIRARYDARKECAMAEKYDYKNPNLIFRKIPLGQESRETREEIIREEIANFFNKSDIPFSFTRVPFYFSPLRKTAWTNLDTRSIHFRVSTEPDVLFHELGELAYSDLTSDQKEEFKAYAKRYWGQARKEYDSLKVNFATLDSRERNRKKGFLLNEFHETSEGVVDLSRGHDFFPDIFKHYYRPVIIEAKNSESFIAFEEGHQRFRKMFEPFFRRLYPAESKTPLSPSDLNITFIQGKEDYKKALEHYRGRNFGAFYGFFRELFTGKFNPFEFIRELKRDVDHSYI